MSKRTTQSTAYTKVDFTVNQRVRVLDGDQRDETGYIYTMHEETAVVQLDNGLKRAYEFCYLAPVEVLGDREPQFITKDEVDEDGSLLAGIAAGDMMIEAPIADIPSPFEGGGGESAGGGASASWSDSPPDISGPGADDDGGIGDGCTSSSADFSNVESGSDSTASDSGASDSGGGGD